MLTDDEVLKVKMELREHEIQCEERWKTTFTRFDRIEEQLIRMEQRQMAGLGTLVVFLAGIVVAVATQT